MAKHSLVRIKGSLVNTPHLIESNSFNSIMDYVNKRIEGSADIIPKMLDDEDDFELSFSNYNPETRTGFLSISGPTTYRRTGWEALCGGVSYESLKEDMKLFVEQGARTVVMDVNSGGGEAQGMIDSAKYIRQLADENNIKIVGFADGSACSAAYGLLSIADEIVATVDSSIGSVGVLISLTDSSRALEKEGYKKVFVTAGQNKIPFADDGSFKPEFIDRLQTQVNELYERFTAHVAEQRGMSQEAVKNTEADVFSAKEALELGLIDQIMTFEQFDDYLVDLSQRNLEGGNVSKGLINRFMKTKEEKIDMNQLQELQALAETQESLLQAKEAELSASLEQITTLQASLEELTGSLASLQAFADEHKAAAEAAQAEAARIAEEQAQAKLDARKAAISAAYAEDQVEATFAALSGLDDASFKLIVDQQLASKEARAKAFEAIGNEGVESENTSAVEQGSVNTILQVGVENARAKFKR